MNTRVQLTVTKTPDGTIAIVTDVSHRNHSIARDTSCRGYVVREKVKRGDKVRFTGGVWLRQ